MCIRDRLSTYTVVVDCSSSVFSVSIVVPCLSLSSCVVVAGGTGLFPISVVVAGLVGPVVERAKTIVGVGRIIKTTSNMAVVFKIYSLMILGLTIILQFNKTETGTRRLNNFLFF